MAYLTETLRSLNARVGALLQQQQIADPGTDFPPLGLNYLEDLLELGLRAQRAKEAPTEGADEDDD